MITKKYRAGSNGESVSNIDDSDRIGGVDFKQNKNPARKQLVGFFLVGCPVGLDRGVY